MQSELLSLVLAGLGRDALKVAAGLALAVVIALAFAISSVSALLGVAEAGSTTASTQDRSVFLVPNAPSTRVVALARTQVGRPYVWGGASPTTSFDCSGLVQWVYREIGISLPRTAQEQFDATLRISSEQLQPGDLVFFSDTYPTTSAAFVTHVGIYVGNGRMINAPSEGDVIRELPVFAGYWGAHYVGAGQVQGGR